MRVLMAALLVWGMATGLAGNASALTVILQNNNNDTSGGPLRLISSTPYDRQVLNEAPEEISLTFAQPIRPHKSYIRVYDAFGQQSEVGELESEGMNLSVTLPALSPGKYKAKWRVRCMCDADSEISGHFYFTIR